MSQSPPVIPLLSGFLPNRNKGLRLEDLRGRRAGQLHPGHLKSALFFSADSIMISRTAIL